MSHNAAAPNKKPTAEAGFMDVMPGNIVLSLSTSGTTRSGQERSRERRRRSQPSPESESAAPAGHRGD